MVAQVLNHHDDIKIFDEIDLVQVGRFGAPVVGTLHAFLAERGVYDTYRCLADKSSDPAAALSAVMRDVARPCTIWGEKNPTYARRMGALRSSFPDALVLFVLRDPRDVVNSCLRYRSSPSRGPTDFWIKDTVAEALAATASCLDPLMADDSHLVVLHYEAFIARPEATLNAAFGPWGLRFSNGAAPRAHPAPETAGDHQFFRDGALLPWKAGNLHPLRDMPLLRERIDADDPDWASVDALARRFGYD